MKTVLLISSMVSASMVGAGVTAFSLSRLGHQPVILPTVMLGRHPGWGAPGGGAVSVDRLKSLWSAVKAQNIVFDSVMTGYFASAPQVRFAAQIIDEVRANNKETSILVDPVMGDHGQLYVPKSVAHAIIKTLIPRADVITPNSFELSYITQTDFMSDGQLINAARVFTADVIVSSVPFGPDIGAILKTEQAVYEMQHSKFNTQPHGTGDMLAGAYLANHLSGQSAMQAFQSAVSSVFSTIKTARSLNSEELPIIASQTDLVAPKLIPIKRYKHA